MFKYVGKCCCNDINITISLPESLEKYSIRECDCDFCMKRNISYLSHPDANLDIKTTNPLAIQKQGSNQANFLTCRHCNSVIAASINISNNLIGALNANLLSDITLLQKPIKVSPKALGAVEKITRWEKVWLSITINGQDSYTL